MCERGSSKLLGRKDRDRHRTPGLLPAPHIQEAQFFSFRAQRAFDGESG